jgi:hypothetical protein
MGNASSFRVACCCCVDTYSTKVRRVSPTVADSAAVVGYEHHQHSNNDPRSWSAPSSSPRLNQKKHGAVNPQTSADVTRQQHAVHTSGPSNAAKNEGHNPQRQQPSPRRAAQPVQEGAPSSASSSEPDDDDESMSSGEFEMPSEQPQEQQASGALMFGEGSGPPICDPGMSPAPKRAAARPQQGREQPQRQASWDRPSSDDDDDSIQRHRTAAVSRRAHGFVPGVGPVKICTSQPRAAFSASPGRADDDSDGESDGDNYEGPREDVPAQHTLHL